MLVVLSTIYYRKTKVKEGIMADIREKTIKDFSADLAGERVGWASTIETKQDDGSRVVQVAGGYGTVGSEGARVSRLEDDTREVYTSNANSGVHGLSRACAWNFYVSKERGDNSSWDLTGLKYQACIGTSDYDDFLSKNFSNYFSGVVDHVVVPLEDESQVSWGVGEDEILACIKGRLDGHGAADVYPAMYIAINAVVGRYIYSQSGNNNSTIGEYQFSDPSQALVTRHEIELLGEFDKSMGARSGIGASIIDKIQHQRLRKSDAAFYDDHTLKIEETFSEFVHGSILPQPFMCSANLPASMSAQQCFDDPGVLAVANAVEHDTKSLQRWRALSGPSLSALRVLHDNENLAGKK